MARVRPVEEVQVQGLSEIPCMVPPQDQIGEADGSQQGVNIENAHGATANSAGGR